MKFDLIISNPPYNKGLDLKILESVLDLGEKICFVHPIGWMLRDKNKKLKLKLEKSLIFDGNQAFTISSHTPCAINLFAKND